MRWDYKLVSYLLLIYFFYGLINLLELSDFVVPLPLSFIFTLLTSFLFSLKTKFSICTFLFFCIPLIMLKDLFIYNYELLGVILILLSVTSWITLGILLIRHDNESTLVKITGILLICSPILFISYQITSSIYLITLLIVSFKTLQKNSLVSNIPLERSLLALTFLIALFLLNETSNWLVD